MFLIGGSADNGIGEKVARALDAKFAKAETKTFPDGELLARANCGAEGDDIVIVQSTYAPQDTHLMELFLLASAAAKQNPRSITAVVPYLAYLRQDKAFSPGEAVSAEVILDLMHSSGVTNLVVAQPHKIETLNKFKGKSIPVLPSRSLMDYVSKELESPYILAPDKGSFPFAKDAAAQLDCGCTFIDKERSIATGEVSIKNAPAERFDGKQVVILDDMISTGGTTAQAAKFAYSRGASEVVAAAVHLLMSDNAAEKLRDAGVLRVYGTNSMPSKNTRQIDISSELASAVRSIL